jgi:hypothetical protein
MLMPAMTTSRARWLVTAVAAFGVLLAIGPPALQSAGHPDAAFLGRLALSPVCHQAPERSIRMWGFPAAVCARCLGIYAGFLGVALLGSLRAASRRPRALPRAGSLSLSFAPSARILLALGAAPAALQWTLARLPGIGPPVDGNLPRAVTGWLLGSAAAAILLIATSGLDSRSSPPRRRPRSPHAKETLHAPTA